MASSEQEQYIRNRRLAEAVCIPFSGRLGASELLFADFDGDGQGQLVAASTGGTVTVYDARSMTKDTVSHRMQWTGLGSVSALLAGDILNDKRVLLGVVTADGFLHVFLVPKLDAEIERSTVTPLAQHPVCSSVASAVVGDIDGDGCSEIVFGTTTRDLFVYRLMREESTGDASATFLDRCTVPGLVQCLSLHTIEEKLFVLVGLSEARTLCLAYDDDLRVFQVSRDGLLLDLETNREGNSEYLVATHCVGQLGATDRQGEILAAATDEYGVLTFWSAEVRAYFARCSLFTSAFAAASPSPAPYSSRRTRFARMCVHLTLYTHVLVWRCILRCVHVCYERAAGGGSRAPPRPRSPSPPGVAAQRSDRVRHNTQRRNLHVHRRRRAHPAVVYQWYAYGRSRLCARSWVPIGNHAEMLRRANGVPVSSNRGSAQRHALRLKPKPALHNSNVRV